MLQLRRKQVEFIQKIEKSRTSNERKKKADTHCEDFIFDIALYIESRFHNIYLSQYLFNSEMKFIREMCNDAQLLARQLSFFRMKPSEAITKLIQDYEKIEDLINTHNNKIITQKLNEYRIFFDHCLQYPLDPQQRRSIVSEEDNCLVISSAGSGKTSSIIGKVKYLTKICHVDPAKILLISYTNKAANELTERIGTPGLKGYTFHKLAIDIISKGTGEKPSICDNTDALFVKIYRDLLKNDYYKNNVIRYYSDYQSQMSEDDRILHEQRQQLSEQKSKRVKALLPDMDGKAIFVRSEQEKQICFILSSLGVKFKYEEPYEYPLADEMHSQYRPDFSIFYDLPNNKTKRVYIEHFGVNERGLVPQWFAQENNISYEEANRKYNDSIAWKKAAHTKFGTTLITTTSADFYNGDIREILKKRLSDAGVPIAEQSDSVLYNMLLPENSKQEKAFIRLIATFTALLKSSCKSLPDILKAAERADDLRSHFVIKNIFYPIYEQYTRALRELNQIDFTDIILRATDICRKSSVVSYEHIIVDEFQDISVDRYNFLKVLREGKPPAKLYCVGDDWQSIYRFSGSDMTLFNQFTTYFGVTDINKIETTYRFGEPLIGLSTQFICQNAKQINKKVVPYNTEAKTELNFYGYTKDRYCNIIESLVASIPSHKSIFLLGRYSFDDLYLSSYFQSVKEGAKFYYLINNRKIEFLTVHKSKGLEADYAILLQCNRDTYGFPSQISDDPALKYVLTEDDLYPYSEERRLFYVAITRAKVKTIILYDQCFPSVFVEEFLHPQKGPMQHYAKYPNANQKWTRGEDNRLLTLYRKGMSIKEISQKLGRSQTSIVMRLEKLTKPSKKRLSTRL